MALVTIRNPNDTGRTAAGIGVIPAHGTKKVPEEVAARVCDGENLILEEKSVSESPTRRKPSTPSS